MITSQAMPAPYPEYGPPGPPSNPAATLKSEYVAHKVQTSPEDPEGPPPAKSKRHQSHGGSHRSYAGSRGSLEAGGRKGSAETGHNGRQRSGPGPPEPADGEAWCWMLQSA